VTDDAHRDPSAADAPASSGPAATTAPGEADSTASGGLSTARTPAAAATPPPRGGSGSAMPEYKGDELDAERGPGLGCFWFQVVLLVFFIILTPLTVELQWPPLASAILLFVTLGLLLFVGQTVIFLLRIVAAERRGRRRPLASPTPTVGEIEESVDAGVRMPAAAPSPPSPGSAGAPGMGPAATDRPDGDEGVRQ
jgi:hypothetical protein